MDKIKELGSPTWECTGHREWSLGWRFENMVDKVIGRVKRNHDGSWQYFVYADTGSMNGEMPSRDEAMRATENWFVGWL